MLFFSAKNLSQIAFEIQLGQFLQFKNCYTVFAMMCFQHQKNL